MPSKAAVAIGTLPTTGSSNYTVSGFGTVSAAIIIASTANTSANPAGRYIFSIGFWDGVNSVQHCVASDSVNNVDPTQSDRWKSTSQAVIIGATITYTCSAVSDGITLTVDTGSTSATRYVTVILIGGATDVHLAEQDLGTGTSAIDITAPAFKPSLVFLASAGIGGAGSQTGVNAMLSFGVAHNNSSDVVSQAGYIAASVDAVGTSQADHYITDTYCGGQLFNGTLDWAVSVGSFDANGFSITPSASAGSDYISYLAIELADPDDAWVDIIDGATSTGNSATSGLGFSPDMVGLVAGSATALGTSTGDNVISFGAGDDTREQCLSSTDDDDAAVSDTSSEANTTNILRAVFGDGSQNALASLITLDSDGFTLNYSDAASSAIKILAFAIGDSTAGAGFSPYWAAGSNVIMNNGSP